LGIRLGTLARIAAGRSCEAYTVESEEPGGGQWIVRVPAPGTDRSIRFHAEAALGALLADGGHPVAPWKVVDVDGTPCAVGVRLTGTPIIYETAWTTAFSAELGDLLADLHLIPAVGFGPLVDKEDELRGQSTSARDGARDRWCWASCWPFDGSDLADHPVSRMMPEVASAIAPLQQELLDAAEEPIGIVHSDLHQEHLLAGPDGTLTGVLDFGDAFIGSVAWDFALLHWYYGPDVSESVARRHPNGPEIARQGRLLATALGIYKLAKSPTDPQIPRRLQRVFVAN
jgi:aminoglycoside phosphotransferase (APT) family kinase protein